MKVAKKAVRTRKRVKIKAKPQQHSDIFTTERKKRNGLLATYVTVRSQPLITFFRDNADDEAAWWDTKPVVPVASLFKWVERLEVCGIPHAAALVSYLKVECKSELEAISNLMADNKITFDLLWYYFKVGDEVCYSEQGTKIAGRIKRADYHVTWMTVTFRVTIDVIVTTGRAFACTERDLTIRPFDGVMNVAELGVQKLDIELKAALTKRGEFFRTIGVGPAHLEYTGNIFQKSWLGARLYAANGRCMIDEASFRRTNPNYEGCRDTSDKDTMEFIPDDLLWMCDGHIKGFSLSTKRWGEFSIDNLTQVKFDDKAFDLLVLEDPKAKKLILTLATNEKFTFQDIIQGKGGGVIYLLYGGPGTGKTLTAESISELLHKPLYNVSVGELGTDPDTLEQRLREILEMATLWDAHVLLDEADIFLEARSEDDISRNAMVAIFLRMLEYHQGVLFMTTNRVKSFDPAFFSRISIAIKYSDLDGARRFQIWKNLLGAAGVTTVSEESIKVLSGHAINGRQIKSAIRLSQALAKSEETPVQERHVMMVIEHTEKFIEETGHKV